MENKFYTDDEFEHFLKDATDNFRMYPSKKVWYSIYNDLHPSRKWPSLAVCLLLIFAILFVGVSNNNSINESKRATAKNNFLINDPQIQGNDGSNVNSRSVALGSFTRPSGKDLESASRTTAGIAENVVVLADVSSLASTNNTTTGQVENNIIITGNKGYNVTITAPTTDDESTGLAIDKVSSTTTGTDEILVTTNTDDLQTATPPVATTNNAATLTTAELNKKATLNKEMSAEDKAWIENFAYNNKASISRFKANASIEYYVTPSIGFRFLKKNNDFEPSVNQQALVTNSVRSSLDINDEVTQKSAINMEAGVALLYNIAKKVRLKAGIQLNYTSYISFADELKHPAQTSLLYNTNNGGYTLESRRSNFANTINGDKNARLNNKTVQLSLPVGADFKLLGKNNLKLYAGATIQPSFTTGGQVFAISADAKNYVEQTDLLRKWNVAAGLETFLSYKTPGGIMINAGPQLRYQLLSTYGKQYSYTEKLYNIGVKLGITKTF